MDLAVPIHCGLLRVNSDFGYDIVDSVQVDVFKDGGWVTVHDGPIDDASYTEISFAPCNVSQARYRFHYLVSGYYFWLYDFQFYESPPVVVAPTVATLAAGSVEDISAVLHGSVVDAGGAPCEYRFEWGTTANYDQVTDWSGSNTVAGGGRFGTVITGLVDGTTYHYHAQARNSAGIVASGDDLTFTASPASASNWLTPTGVADAGNWESVERAYDDETTSFARINHALFSDQWSDYLTFTHAPVNVSGIRFLAKADSYIDQAEVDLSADGANWTTVYQGLFEDGQWLTVGFDAIPASNFRIRFHVSTGGVGEYFQLNEFNFTANRMLAGPAAFPSTPASSITSPAWVEGTSGPDVTGLSAIVNGGIPFNAERYSPFNWYATNSAAGFGIDLTPGASTHVDFVATNGTLTQTTSQDLTWTPTDLKGLDTSNVVTIRRGDSLLLTDSDPGVSLWIDTGTGGTPVNFGGQPGDFFPCQFGAAGSYLITATVKHADHTQTQSWLTVRVVDVNLDGPIACELGFQREKDVFIFGGTSGDVTFTGNTTSGMAVAVEAPTATGATLFLTPSQQPAAVLARLGGPDGALLRIQNVDVFTLYFSNAAQMLINQATRTANPSLIIRPALPGLDATFAMFAHTSTFEGGATSLTTNTSLWQPYTPDGTTENDARFDYIIEVPDGENATCYRVDLFQNGVRVSFDH